MRNFTGGRGKNTLDYMVRKYESDMYQFVQHEKKHAVLYLSSYPFVASAASAFVILKFYSAIFDFLVFKGTVQKYIYFLLPVVLFINVDGFGVSCRVLEISAVEISAFSLI